MKDGFRPVIPKNLFYLVEFRLKEAIQKRDENAKKEDREAFQLWRGKAKAYRNVLDLMGRKA